MKSINLKKIKGAIRKKLKRLRPAYPKISIREPRHLIKLPSFRLISKVNVKYPLLEPFVYAHIKWIPKDKKLIYNIIEPTLTPYEEKNLKKIRNDLIELIDIKLSVIKKRSLAIKYIQDKVNEIIEDTGMKLSPDKYAKIMYYIIRDFIGLNELEPLMHDPYIEDIGCSGFNTPVFIIHRKFGSIETNIIYNDFGYLSNFVVKLSERCGRYISYAKPLLDGTLPDGSRVQASLAKDVTTRGPTFSIRKFRKNPFSPIDMLNLKTTSADMMAYLWFLLDYDISLLICGGVSTGKTTMLNVLSMFISPEKKIISIEDTREINLPHENWIPSVSRTGFGIPEASGKRYGEIELYDLLKESFRQNPDYVVVGEVRGKEAYVMFQGMTSGHPSLGTIHAGSVDDVIKRLETPPIELSPSLIESLDAVIVMVNAQEKGKSSRRVKEINEIQSIDTHTGKAHIIKTFAWIPSSDRFKNDIQSSEILRRLSFERGIPYSKISEEIKNRKRVLEWMQKYGVVQFNEVCKLINLYHKDKDTIMQWVEKNLPPYKTKSKKIIEKIWQSSTGLKTIE